VDQLEASTSAIETFLKGSDWEPKVLGFEAHGSWAHKTIIRPVEGSAFDADLLVNIEEVEGWSAKDYVNELARTFRGSATYKDKVSTSSHCVTINYAGERKIDVAPCLVNRDGWVQREVCDRVTDEYQLTEPTKYTNWLIEQNHISKNNGFRKATRLLKYLRDIKCTFTCPSVLLTTLLASHIYDDDDGSSDFADVPSTLKTILGRIDDYLNANETKPSIVNPFLPTEDFADLWTDSQYTNFRATISRYRTWVDEAFDEESRDLSIKLWRKVFGDEFASDAILTEAKSVSASARQALTAIYKSTTSLAGDLVSLVKQFGRSALPPGFNHMPHMHEPEWSIADYDRIVVRVVATLHRMQQAPALREVNSLDPLPKNHGLWFDVRDGRGQELPIAQYRVQWRITNTDQEAYDARCMRGEFNPPKNGNRRWEELEYRGVHMTEAFVIRRTDNRIVAKSEPFYVTIE